MKLQGKTTTRRAMAAGIAAGLVLAAGTGFAAQDAGSYSDTVQLIRSTMISQSSPARKESYASVSFDGCVMGYTVSGTYPVGEPYTIRFGGLDFSSLNPRESRTGTDYTPFVLLNFKSGFRYRTGSTDISIHSTVINTSDDEGSARLYAAFLRLGELCGAQ